METLDPTVPIMQLFGSVITHFLSGTHGSLSDSMPPVCNVGFLFCYEFEAS